MFEVGKKDNSMSPAGKGGGGAGRSGGAKAGGGSTRVLGGWLVWGMVKPVETEKKSFFYRGTGRGVCTKQIQGKMARGTRKGRVVGGWTCQDNYLTLFTGISPCTPGTKVQQVKETGGTMA